MLNLLYLLYIAILYYKVNIGCNVNYCKSLTHHFFAICKKKFYRNLSDKNCQSEFWDP